jgi:hypothetical protein
MKFIAPRVSSFLRIKYNPSYSKLDVCYSVYSQSLCSLDSKIASFTLIQLTSSTSTMGFFLLTLTVYIMLKKGSFEAHNPIY